MSGFARFQPWKVWMSSLRKNAAKIDVTSSYNWDFVICNKNHVSWYFFKHRGLKPRFSSEFPYVFVQQKSFITLGAPFQPPFPEMGENLQDYVLYLYTSKVEQSQVREPEGCFCGEFPWEPHDMDSMGSERYIYWTFNYPNKKSTIRCKWKIAIVSSWY